MAAPISGWQGMTTGTGNTGGPTGAQGMDPSLLSSDPTQQILGAAGPTGQYAVEQSPSLNIQGGGSPNTAALAGLAMLLA